MAMEPKVLLLDEITSALDPELVNEVLRLVRDLAEQGMTMVIATHEMNFAREVANTVCFLHDGQILEMGPPTQIFEAPRGEADADVPPRRPGSRNDLGRRPARRGAHGPR